MNILQFLGSGAAQTQAHSPAVGRTQAAGAVQPSTQSERAIGTNQQQANKRSDSAHISSAAYDALHAEEQARAHEKTSGTASSTESATEPATESAEPANALTEGEERIITELQSRDREVRQHEQAHKGAAGGVASGAASFSYQQGPDGQRYAVGGHVSIDTSSASDPQQTMRKMDTVRRAALAPANPSSQDRSVAGAASQRKNQALMEYRRVASDEHAAAAKAQEAHNTQEPETAAAVGQTDTDNAISENPRTSLRAPQGAATSITAADNAHIADAIAQATAPDRNARSINFTA